MAEVTKLKTMAGQREKESVRRQRREGGGGEARVTRQQQAFFGIIKIIIAAFASCPPSKGLGAAYNVLPSPLYHHNNPVR